MAALAQSVVVNLYNLHNNTENRAKELLSKKNPFKFANGKMAEVSFTVS